MAAVHVEPNKKGKKPLNMELNLVPFIDLLSCLISFLLITAVWTQISAVPAQLTGNLQTEPPPKDPNDPTIDVRVTLHDTGYTLSLQGIAKDIPKVNKDGQLIYDAKQLTDILKGVRQRIPQQKVVTIAADDTIAFVDLSDTMDQVIASGGATAPFALSVMPAVN